MKLIIMHYDKLYYEDLDMTTVECFGEDAIKVNYAPNFYPGKFTP